MFPNHDDDFGAEPLVPEWTDPDQALQMYREQREAILDRIHAIDQTVGRVMERHKEEWFVGEYYLNALTRRTDELYDQLVYVDVEIATLEARRGPKQ